MCIYIYILWLYDIYVCFFSNHCLTYPYKVQFFWWQPLLPSFIQFLPLVLFGLACSCWWLPLSQWLSQKPNALSHKLRFPRRLTMLLFSRASLELLFSNFMQLLFSSASRGLLFSNFMQLLFSHDSYKLPHNRAGLQPNAAAPKGEKGSPPVRRHVFSKVMF